MAKERSTTAERVGLWVGGQWRNYARREASAVQWLSSKGVPGYIAKTMAWIFRLSLLLMVLFIVFLIATITAIAYVSAKCRGAQEPEEWAIGKKKGIKQHGFIDHIHHDKMMGRRALISAHQ